MMEELPCCVLAELGKHARWIMEVLEMGEGVGDATGCRSFPSTMLVLQLVAGATSMTMKSTLQLHPWGEQMK